MKPIRPRSIALWLAFVLPVLSAFDVATVHAQNAKSSPQALIIYGDATNFQNNGVFDLAAEEWEKFLTKFPNDPLAPKAQHYQGVCNLQLKKYQKAADAFAVVIAKYASSENIQDAYLNLGWCQYSLGGQDVEGMYAKAAATFSEMVEKFPKGKYTDQALFFWGESEYRQGKKKQAIAAYDQLVKGHPKSKLRTDAIYALGVTYEELEQYSDAGPVYDLFLEECAESDLVTEVRMRKAETILQAGEFAAAEKIFGEVAGVEGFAQVDHAIFRQAYCLAKLDKFAEAGALYAKIPAEHEQSVYVREGAMSAGRCFYRAESLKDAAKWLQAAVDAADRFTPEAAHWLSRVHLKQNEPQKVPPLVDKVLAGAADSKYAVTLKMDRADALYEIEDSRPQALEMYLKIATDHAKHELAPQSLYNAAFAAMELGQHEDGLKHCDAFLQAYPEDRLVPDVKYVVAECRLLMNQHEQAEKAYQELTAAYPEHAEIEMWKVRLGSVIYLQKKYQHVVDTLTPLLPTIKRPDSLAETRFLIGVSQFFLKKYDVAVNSLRASLQAKPKWRQADETMIYLSRALHAQDNATEAIETIAKTIADFPKSRHLDRAHYRHGEYSSAAGDYETALAQYEKVVTQWPDSTLAAYALYGKGWSQFKSKKYDEAVETFTALISNHANHKLVADTHFARGMCQRQIGQFDDAIKDLNAYLQSEPAMASKSDALYERGRAEAAKKEHSAAAATFEQLLKENPQYPNVDDVLYELAWEYKSTGDASNGADAVARFAKLASQCPDSPWAGEANFHVGESHYEKKEFAEAKTAYTAAKDKKPGKELGEKVAYKLGWSNYHLKEYEAALAEFEGQATDYPQGPLQADALFMKAECLFSLEKHDEALPAYTATQELKLAPANTVLALLHGGQCASQLKQWDEAIAFLSQIPEKHADSRYLPESHYELGWAKQNADKVDEALKDYEQAATTSRVAVGARARFMIGELYFGQKKHKEAIPHFQRVMFGYGGDNAPADVKNWQAKAGYDAARCSEVQIQGAKPADRGKLIADAKKYYQYVIEKHPQNDLAPKAKERLAELSKL